MSYKPTILVCKRVRFYALKDEDAFFAWIKKMDCIEDFYGEGDELYLEMVNLTIHEHELRDLIGLFYRYNIDMKQLRIFLNDENRSWFYENKKAYWVGRVFDE